MSENPPAEEPSDHGGDEVTNSNANDATSATTDASATSAASAASEASDGEERLIELLGGREDAEAFKQSLRDIMEDPSILQRPENAGLREAVGRLVSVVRNNPDLYPLEVDGEGGNGESVNIECFCSRDNMTASSPSNNEGHTSFCRHLQPFRRQLDDDLGESYDLAHELFSMSQKSSFQPDYNGPTVSISDAQSKLLQEKALKYYCMFVGYSRDLVSLYALEELPMLLVAMGKYDELCALLVNSTRNNWRGALPQNWRQRALEGEFPFAVEEDSSLEDLNDVISVVQSRRNSETLPFLVSFFFMKVRLLCSRRQEREEWAESIRLMIGTTSGGRILEPVGVQCIIIEMATGAEEYRDPIEAQIAQIMDTIDARNPSMLPALVHPAPIKESMPQPLAPILLPRTPAEAFPTMLRAEPLCLKIPEAMAILVARFGETPRYHHDPFDYTAEEANFVS